MSTTADIEVRLKVGYAATLTSLSFRCTTLGIQIFMFAYGLYIYSQTRKEVRRGREIYLAASFLILALDAADTVLYVVYVFNLIWQKTSNALEVIQLSADLLETRYMIAEDCLSTLVICVGDGLLVYRCYVVWTGRRIISLLPISLYLAFIAVSIWSIVSIGFLNSPSVQLIWTSLTVAVNCLATLLISIRLLLMRRRQAAILQSLDSRMYTSIIAILTESALPFAVAGLFFAISYSTQPAKWSMTAHVVENVANILFNTLCPLAPQLIIFRVATGQSFVHSSHISAPVSSLEFQKSTAHDFAGTMPRMREDMSITNPNSSVTSASNYFF